MTYFVGITEQVCTTTQEELFGTAWVGPNVCIKGPVVLGNHVKIYPGVVIGYGAEVYDESKQSSSSPIFIGDYTVIRENVVIQRGLDSDPPTEIGRNCYVMHGCHIAHNCVLGDYVSLAPKVVLGGHTDILRGATLGIGSMTHQWTTIGAYAMVGMGSVVTRDVSTGLTVIGCPAKLLKENEVGLVRHKPSAELLVQTAKLFNEIRRRKGNKRGVITNVSELWE